MSVKDLQLILPELTPGLAIQVGSQSGNEAQYLADIGFDVLCVDPEPLNKSRDRITVLAAAASDKPGIQLMYRAGGMNSLDRDYVQNWRGQPVEIEYAASVPVIRICDLDLKPNLVIIDAEGTDHKVLKGLFGHNPEVVMFEMTKTYPERCKSCLETLRNQGYHRFLAIFHCGDDILDVAEVYGEPVFLRDDVDWFANIVAKLDPNPWRLND